MNESNVYCGDHNDGSDDDDDSDSDYADYVVYNDDDDYSDNVADEGKYNDGHDRKDDGDYHHGGDEDAFILTHGVTLLKLVAKNYFFCDYCSPTCTSSSFYKAKVRSYLLLPVRFHLKERSLTVFDSGTLSLTVALNPLSELSREFGREIECSRKMCWLSIGDRN